MPDTFSSDEITDVRILIKAKGKHYGLVVNTEMYTEEEAKQIRIGFLLSIILPVHCVVSTPLEDLKSE